MNTKETKTKLTLESFENTVTWESPHSDVNMEDLLSAFYGLCIAVTWMPQTVLEEMKAFAESHLEVLNLNKEDICRQIV